MVAGQCSSANCVGRRQPAGWVQFSNFQPSCIRICTLRVFSAKRYYRHEFRLIEVINTQKRFHSVIPSLVIFSASHASNKMEMLKHC